MKEAVSNQTTETFSLLVRQAKLYRRMANRDMAFLQRAGNAEDHVVAYATECLAQQIHETGVFSTEVQERFRSVSEAIDRDSNPRPDTKQRKALLKRAEAFASFSPHHEADDETYDNDQIAAALNKRPRYLLGQDPGRIVFDRDLGRAVKPLPAFTGGPDRSFKPVEARRLTDQLGHLQQVLCDHVRHIDQIFADNRDKIPHDPVEIASELQRVDQDFALRQRSDLALGRIVRRQGDKLWQIERRDLRTAKEDPFVESTLSSKPQQNQKRSREAISDKGSSATGPSTGKRHRMEEPSPVKSSSSTSRGLRSVMAIPSGREADASSNNGSATRPLARRRTIGLARIDRNRDFTIHENQPGWRQEATARLPDKRTSTSPSSYDSDLENFSPEREPGDPLRSSPPTAPVVRSSLSELQDGQTQTRRPPYEPRTRDGREL